MDFSVIVFPFALRYTNNVGCNMFLYEVDGYHTLTAIL